MKLDGVTECGCDSRRHPGDGRIALGIYEKALLHTGDWDEFFGSVREAGFSFCDLSIDESPQRMARLRWPMPERRLVRDAAARHGVQIGGLCLSVHRTVGPGSSDPAVREKARAIYSDAIWLAHDLGVPVVQVAGYYAFYEDPHEEQRARYVDALRQATAEAARAGVILAIENVDGNDVTSVAIAKEICDDIASPWCQLYPDLGNIALQHLDMTEELRLGAGRMVALHIKDVRENEPRRVPLGDGIADFAAAMTELARQQWAGRLMIEMWNDDHPDSIEICRAARIRVEEWLTQAGIDVVTTRSNDA